MKKRHDTGQAFPTGKKPSLKSEQVLGEEKKKKKYARFPVDPFGNPDTTRYKIVRFYHPDKGGGNRVIKRHLTGEEAHKHVNDPKTSVAGKYFDGFDTEG